MNRRHGTLTVLGAGALSLALVGAGCAGEWHERHQEPAYTSSVQVKSAEEGEHEHRHDGAALAKVAKIELPQAVSTAVSQVPGTVLSARLENEGGNVVYAVEILTAAGVTEEVRVDAGNAAVLHVGEEREHCDKD